MTEEINYFVCGYCVWAQMMEAPEDQKEKYPKKRGFCRANPPAVFPIPAQQQTKIAGPMGQQPKVQMQPYMIRPVVEADEPMCGKYTPNPEAVKGLGLRAGGEGGCDRKHCECEGESCGS